MPSSASSARTEPTTWGSTEFWQSAFVQATGAVALFMGIIDGTVYVGLSGLALGIYVSGRSYQKRERWRVDNERGRDHAPRLEDW